MSKKYSLELVLERKYKKPSYIIGNLFMDGKWYCNTLEPPLGTDAEMRTAGSKKAILPGTYNVNLIWSQHFKKQLPRLENVPGRIGILIHAGNDPRDSTGCILVGQNTQVGKVLNSKETLHKLISIIRLHIKCGLGVTLTIK